MSAYDPVVKKIASSEFEALQHSASVQACLAGAHCCVVVTEWEEFKALTPDDFIEHMAEPIVVDARRIFDPQEFRQRLRYVAVGLRDDQPVRKNAQDG